MFNFGFMEIKEIRRMEEEVKKNKQRNEELMELSKRFSKFVWEVTLPATSNPK